MDKFESRIHELSRVEELHYLRLELAEKSLLPKAEAGELWAIQNILKLVAEALADGVKLNTKVALFISKALIKIYDGEKADNAFGIARKRGERDNRKSRQRNFSIAYEIEKARKYDGLTIESAEVLAATKYHVSYDTAKKAVKDHGKEARRNLELHDKMFG